MFIDSHAHLQMSHFDNDVDDVLKRSLDEGVSGIMLVGSNEADSLKGVLLAQKHDFLYASIGVHPHDVKGIDDSTYARLKEIARNHKVHAYGEIGLDFYKNHSPRDLQIEHFRRQIDLADELALPLLVHIRDAYEECYKIFLEKKDKLKKRGVIHCFSSDRDYAKKFIDLGFYISFSGSLTYKNSAVQLDALLSVDMDDVMIETDCPYLTPIPNRGKRNEPFYVKDVAKFIADAKGLSTQDVGRITSRNFYDLINIKSVLDETKIAYKIRNSLYINLTNRCTNDCYFCARERSYVVKGHNLKLQSEPSVEDVVRLIGDPRQYDEVVFCGYGEPLIRLDEVIAISKYVKGKGGRVRINTNGQANLIHKKNVIESLKGLVDEISISLNAENSVIYNKICHCVFNEDVYGAVKKFILDAKDVIPKVTASVVDLPEIDLKACEKIAKEELGVNFRVRKLNVVG